MLPSASDVEALEAFCVGCEDRVYPLGDIGTAPVVRFPGGWQRRERPDPASTAAAVTHAAADVEWDDDGQLREGMPKRERVSSITETAHLFSAFVRLRIRTLAFCGVRKLVELVLRYSKKDLGSDRKHAHLAAHVSSYRGGYTKEERRLIESQLFGGSLLGVTATCALELGVDVGMLDCTLHMGFPRSFSSLWQQMGRCGRSGRPSLSIFVCFDSPVDQFFARNPAVLFHSPAEAVALNPENDAILRAHLLCAAKEIPLKDDVDRPYWGDKYPAMRRTLVESKDLVTSNPLLSNTQAGGGAEVAWRVHPLHPLGAHMAGEVSIRMIDPVTISVVDDSRDGAVIDTIEYSRSFFTLFEAAIHMHNGAQYLVSRLDLLTKKAHARPVNVNYYTQAMNRTDINVVKVLETRGVLNFGTIGVVKTVSGYVKRWISTGEVFEEGACSMPPLSYETRGIWIDLPVSTKRELTSAGFDPADALHAANHALVTFAPLLLYTDKDDVATEHFTGAASRVLLYDKQAGGVGACDELFTRPGTFATLLRRAADTLSSCPCQSDADGAKRGCHSCLFLPVCNAYNEHLSKGGAMHLLKLLVELVEGAADLTAQCSPVAVGKDHAGRGRVGGSGGGDRSGTPGTAGSTGRSVKAKAGERDKDTPRKRQRKDALRAARFGGHPGKISIHAPWVDSMPDFVTDKDMT